jgi:hypothetical protein
VRRLLPASLRLIRLLLIGVDKTELAWQLMGVLFQDQVNPFANVHCYRNLSPIVKYMQSLVLFGRDIYSRRDLLARHFGIRLGAAARNLRPPRERLQL